MTRSTRNKRNTGLDLLRFVLMSLGVVLHVLCAYLTSYQIPEFPVFDGSAQFWGADALVLLIHSFRMPLFFMISGFLAGHSLAKPNEGATALQVASKFLQKRFQRIGLPWLGSMVLILPVFHWCLTNFQTSEVPFRFEMSFLWFLYHLLIINIVVGVFRKPYVYLTKRPLWMGVVASIALTLWTLSEDPTGVLMTSDHWLPPASLLLVHFGYFALGGILWNQGTVQRPPWTWKVWVPTTISLICLSLFYIAGVQKIFHGETQWLWPVNFVHSALTLGLSMALFLCFTRRQWSPQKPIQYLADSSYTIYLIHPVGIALLVPLASSNLHIWPQLIRPSFVFILTFAGSFIAYKVFVRRTPLGKVL